jgi:tricorn protease
VVIENKTAGAEELAVSSDGEEFALVIEGEIVLVSKELGGRSNVAIPGAHRERHISFKPGTADTLLFVTDRFGEDQVCLLISADEEDPTLRTAREFKIIQLTDHKRPATEPLWSPEGDRILYTRGNGDLRVMDADGDNDKALHESWSVGGYSWSPDGRWVAYSHSDNNFNSEIMIIPSEGGDPVNVTMHPDYDNGPVWSADGTMLAWTSHRHSTSPSNPTTDVFFLYLQRELDERTKEEWEIWEKTRDKKKDKKPARRVRAKTRKRRTKRRRTATRKRPMKRKSSKWSSISRTSTCAAAA